MTDASDLYPALKYNVWVRNNGENYARRIAEFARDEDAQLFARSILDSYDHVFVGGIVRDIEPEPLHITITLNGKNIAQVEAMLTRMERAADGYEPYIDSITNND